MILDHIVQAVLFGTILTAIVELVLRSQQRLNAATRYAIWWITMAATLALLFVPTAGDLRLAGVLPAAAPIQLPKEFAAIAALISAMLAAVWLARLVCSYRHVQRLRLTAAPADAELNTRLAAWLKRYPTRRNVKVMLSRQVRSPLAIGMKEPLILLPESLASRVSSDELDQIGLHELAHLRRYDDCANALQYALQTVFCFHPAVWYIVQQLSLEREMACDDWVLAGAQAPQPYARCLAKLAELKTPGMVLAPGAAIGKKQIFRRIEMLLDRSRNSVPSFSGIGVTLAAVALAGMLMQFSALPRLIAFADAGGWWTNKMSWNDGEHRTEIKMRGDIRFGDDDRSIQQISPDGAFVAIEETGWTMRRIEAKPDASGTPQLAYTVNNVAKPMDSIGQEWVAGLIMRVIRQTGWNAPERVQRIFTQGGAGAVLREISSIDGDQIVRVYSEELLKTPGLTLDDRLRTIRQAGRQMHSDHEKASFLKTVAESSTDDRTLAPVLDSIAGIHSDFERKELLLTLLRNHENNKEVQLRTVDLAARMNSDFDKAQVLKAASETFSDVSSPDGRAPLVRLLQAVRRINSDFEKTAVLRKALDKYANDAELRAALFPAINSINSDNDRKNILETVLNGPKLDDAARNELLGSVAAMRSDHDKSEVLRIFMDRQSSDAVPDRYFDVVETVRSEFDRKQLLEHQIDGHPKKETVLRILTVVESMRSENDKANLFSRIIDNYSDPDIRAAVRKSALTLHSDNEYRRLISRM